MPASRHTFELTQEDLQRASFVRLANSGDGTAVPYFGDDESYPRVWDINDLKDRPQASWLIKHIVEHKGLTVFFGPDKTGKTAALSNFLWAWTSGASHFLTQDFEMTGEERRVLYVLLEGQQNFYARYDAWCHAYNNGNPVEGFYVVDEGLALFDENMQWEKRDSWTPSAKKLWNAVDALRPHILVIDTLSRATAGMNENSSSMAHVVGVLDHLRDVYDLSTVIVHHTALDKAASDRPRGHSSLKGAASSYVSIKGEPEDQILHLKTGPHRNSDAYLNIPFKRVPEQASFVIEVGPMRLSLQDQLFTLAPISLDNAALTIYNTKEKVTIKRVRALIQNHPGLQEIEGQVVRVEAGEVDAL